MEKVVTMMYTMYFNSWKYTFRQTHLPTFVLYVLKMSVVLLAGIHHNQVNLAAQKYRHKSNLNQKSCRAITNTFMIEKC